LTKWNGKKIASESDFDGLSGTTKSKNVLVLDKEKSSIVMKWLINNSASSSSSSTKPMFTISDRQEKSKNQSPLPPFITSTLQQDSSRKLGFSPAYTMKLAQELYEAGHITYMRTDSTTLSASALSAIQSMIQATYGEDYLSKKVGNISSKSSVAAQEAHEAIRPTLPNDALKTSEDLRIVDDAKKLYDLIYRRTIASQMTEAKSITVTYTIDVRNNIDANNGNFRFSQTNLLFPGFLAVYGASAAAGKKGAKALSTPLMNHLMNLNIGQRLHLSTVPLANTSVAMPEEEEEESEGKKTRNKEDEEEEEIGQKQQTFAAEYPGLLSTEHSTRPPTRFTEASFIAELEELGVGRPSTYSKILQVLKEREYIIVDKKTIIPTVKGCIVSQFLKQYLSQFINENFTAKMEKSLDDIAHGKLEKNQFLKSFFLGNDSSSSNNSKKKSHNEETDGLFPFLSKLIQQNTANSHFKENSISFPFLQEYGNITLKGDILYLERKEDKRLIRLPDPMKTDLRLITKGSIEELLKIADQPGSMLNRPSVLGKESIPLGNHPKTKYPIELKFGPYGAYLEMKKKRVSLPEWTMLPDVLLLPPEKAFNDTRVLTVAKAIDLFKLPLSLGLHPKVKSEMNLWALHGQLVVFVAGYSDKVTLPSGYWVNDILTNRDNIMETTIIPGLEHSIVGFLTDSPPNSITRLSSNAEDSGPFAISYCTGVYGPYLKCGNVNLSIKKELYPTKESISAEKATELITKKLEKPESTRFLKKTKGLKKTTKKVSAADNNEDDPSILNAEPKKKRAGKTVVKKESESFMKVKPLKKAVVKKSIAKRSKKSSAADKEEITVQEDVDTENPKGTVRASNNKP
jgi:DNA topoisomerase-1